MELGCAAGALAVYLTSVVTQSHAFSGPLFVFMGALLGLIVGAFGGALSGSMNPHATLDKLENQGGIIITVEADSEEQIQRAEKLLQKYTTRIEADGLPGIPHAPLRDDHPASRRQVRPSSSHAH
jgi:hypothetical protein